jgi:hypothetical protein
VHGDDVISIPALYDDIFHTLTFEADKFSTYALVYTAVDTDDGDGTNMNIGSGNTGVGTGTRPPGTTTPGTTTPGTTPETQLPPDFSEETNSENGTDPNTEVPVDGTTAPSTPSANTEPGIDDASAPIQGGNQVDNTFGNPGSPSNLGSPGNPGIQPAVTQQLITPNSVSLEEKTEEAEGNSNALQTTTTNIAGVLNPASDGISETADIDRTNINGLFVGNSDFTGDNALQPHNTITPNNTLIPVGDSADSSDTNTLDNETGERNVEEPEVPLFIADTSWALVNLLLMLLTAIITATLFLTWLKRSYHTEYTKLRTLLLSFIPTIAAIGLFILTQNMNNPMILTDTWTIWMAAIAAVQVAIILLKKQSKEKVH